MDGHGQPLCMVLASDRRIPAGSPSLLALELALPWALGSAAKLRDHYVALAGEGEQQWKCHFQSWAGFGQTRGAEPTPENLNAYLGLRV